jgi:NADH dehydrogenase FAD-containing subunit
MKMAEALAENLERTRLQRSLRPFHYHSFGVILWLEQTGILDLFGYSLESRLVPMLRNFFYNIRFWQLTR